MSTNEKRCYSLDVIKIVATILIVFHHYQQVVGVTFEGGINYYNGKFYFGNIVELFFVISGYFMFGYIGKIKNGLRFKTFYTRRMARLLPLVGVAAVTYEVLLRIHEKVCHEQYLGLNTTLWGIVIDTLGVQEGWGFSNPCVNNPTWYIAVLLLCYAIFWIITYVSGKLEISSRYFYLAMILLGCGIATYGINLPIFNVQSSRGFYAFFTGVLLSTYIYNKKITMKETILSMGILIFLTANIIWNFEFVSNGLTFLLTFFLYPALIILFRCPIIEKIFSRAIWGKLGEISYDVYIWHSPMFILMFILIKQCQLEVNLGTRISMYLFCLITWCVGAISYKLIELPLKNFVKTKLKQG